MKINKKLIILYLSVLLFLIIATLNNNLNFALISSNQFNFITVSTVFAGFLFTSLGIVAGLYSNIALKKFERISTMDRIYGNIILGIIFSLISVVFSLGIIFIKTDEYNLLTNYISKWSNVAQIYFLILTIVQFSISVKYTYFAIKVVRSDIKKNLPDKEDMQETLKKIK
jgi:hypothetical protein